MKIFKRTCQFKILSCLDTLQSGQEHYLQLWVKYTGYSMVSFLLTKKR